VGNSGRGRRRIRRWRVLCRRKGANKSCPYLAIFRWWWRDLRRARRRWVRRRGWRNYRNHFASGKRLDNPPAAELDLDHRNDGHEDSPCRKPDPGARIAKRSGLFPFRRTDHNRERYRELGWLRHREFDPGPSCRCAATGNVDTVNLIQKEKPRGNSRGVSRLVSRLWGQLADCSRQ